jgi:hypothetical protein
MNQEPRRSRDLEDPDKPTAESTPPERKEDRQAPRSSATSAASRPSGEERARVDMPREARVDTSRAEEPAGRETSLRAALFHDDEAHGFRSRWDAIQTGFVDEPRAAVEQADALVAQVVSRVVQVFGEQRTTLESQWDRDRDISTEDLRLALTRYRAFFDRLLSV